MVDGDTVGVGGVTVRLKGVDAADLGTGWAPRPPRHARHLSSHRRAAPCWRPAEGKPANAGPRPVGRLLNISSPLPQIIGPPITMVALWFGIRSST